MELQPRMYPKCSRPRIRCALAPIRNAKSSGPATSSSPAASAGARFIGFSIATVRRTICPGSIPSSSNSGGSSSTPPLKLGPGSPKPIAPPNEPPPHPAPAPDAPRSTANLRAPPVSSSRPARTRGRGRARPASVRRVVGIVGVGRSEAHELQAPTRRALRPTSRAVRLEPGGHLFFSFDAVPRRGHRRERLECPEFRSIDWTTHEEGAPGTRCAARRVTRAAARRRLRVRDAERGDADARRWKTASANFVICVFQDYISYALRIDRLLRIRFSSRDATDVGFVSVQGIARRRASTLFAPRVRRRTHKGTFQDGAFPAPRRLTRRRVDARVAMRASTRRAARHLRASTPRGRSAGCSRSPRGFPPGSRRGAAAAHPRAGLAVASGASSSRQPREMASRWPGRDAARPRSRAHPSRVAY